MLLRPSGILIEGKIETGLEVIIENGIILEIRPHTGIPDPYILSPAFVNAHSHLEYRGYLDKLHQPAYWEWISALAAAKLTEDLTEVDEWTHVAAEENYKCGVGLIGEVSDRPFSGKAMKMHKLGGVIYQEVLTVPRPESAEYYLHKAEEDKKKNEEAFGGKVILSPHTPYTVEESILRFFAQHPEPFSIHLAETELENEFFMNGRGKLVEFSRVNHHRIQPTGERVFDYIDRLGVIKKNVQLIHCCDLNSEEVARIAEREAVVVHCPRSNTRLQCPTAPIREMLDHGILVGLGMDSPASGGVIDFFEEMREAIRVSAERNMDVHAEEVLHMATTMGAESIGFQGWKVEVGCSPKMIKIHLEGITSSEELVFKGDITKIERV